MKHDYKKQGKANRAAGKAFELKVRKDLESKGWFVFKNSNNVEFYPNPLKVIIPVSLNAGVMTALASNVAHLVPCKPKFNPFTKSMMMISGGFPDFLCYKVSVQENKALRELEYKKLNDIMNETAKNDRKRYDELCEDLPNIQNRIKARYANKDYYEVIGVESKSNGTLSPEEKEKCKWLIRNNVFSKILIAQKGTKRGSIEYVDFTEKHK